MIGSERQRTKRGKSAVQKLTTGEVARRLGMSVSTIRNLIAQGELKAERRNTTSQYRILSTELEQYARAHGLTLLAANESENQKA